MPKKSTVRICYRRFYPGLAETWESPEPTSLEEALLTMWKELAEAGYRLGPDNIIEAARVTGETVEAIADFERTREAFFASLGVYPFEEAPDAYRPLGGELAPGRVFVPCPLCGLDLVVVGLNFETMAMIFEFPDVRAFKCGNCGYEMVDWFVGGWFSANTAIFQWLGGHSTTDTAQIKVRAIEVHRFLDELLRTLPPDLFRIVCLRFGRWQEPLEPREIAPLVGLTPRQVSEALKRAKGHLWAQPAFRRLRAAADITNSAEILQLQERIIALGNHQWRLREAIWRSRGLGEAMLLNAHGLTLEELRRSGEIGVRPYRALRGFLEINWTYDSEEPIPLAEIVSFTGAELLAIAQFSRKALDDLRAALKKRGLSLRGEI